MSDAPPPDEEAELEAGITVDPATQRVVLWMRLIERARELGYVAHACEELGVRRTAFYRIWSAWRRGGEPGLRALAHRAVSRSAEHRKKLEGTVVELTIRNPSWGRRKIAKALGMRGYIVTPARVLTLWRRLGLRAHSPELFEEEGE